MGWLEWLQIAATALAVIGCILVYFYTLDLGFEGRRWWVFLEDLAGVALLVATAVLFVALVAAVWAVS
jgi:hypothetical protein